MTKILQMVVDDLKSREERGFKKYGTTMDREDLTRSEWMNHLYEELLDAILYIKKHQHETERSKEVDRGSIESIDTGATIDHS